MNSERILKARAEKGRLANLVITARELFDAAEAAWTEAAETERKLALRLAVIRDALEASREKWKAARGAEKEAYSAEGTTEGDWEKLARDAKSRSDEAKSGSDAFQEMLRDMHESRPLS